MAAGNTVADYLNGPGIDNKLRQTTSGAVSYFATDHLSSTRALTNASGILTSTLNYDSFGNVMGGSAPSRYTYTGREANSDTGLMYYRTRWYDPQVGRFISEDPIGFLIPDMNLYSYVRNNPIRYIDPKGTNPLLVVVAVVGAEVWLHNYLAARSERFYPDDPYGRKKHCYVNCMSSRIHGFNPVWPSLASVEQEVGGLALGLLRGDFKGTVKDSVGDLAADVHGYNVSFLIWRSCQRLCESCPF
jgi:RHS repeat-associated protein